MTLDLDLITWLDDFEDFLEPDQDIVAPLSFRSLTIKRAPSTDVSGNYTVWNKAVVQLHTVYWA